MSATAEPATQPLRIDPMTTALLCVDMQYFDAHRDWGEGRTAKELGVAHYFDAYFAQIDRVTPVIAELLSAFRRKRMEVLHIRVAERTADSRDVGLKQLVRGLIVPSVSKEAEFLEGLEPVGDEIVIDKSSSGVFAVTDLDRLLRNIGIDTLVFVGTSTGGCVQSAVYDATDFGYRVLIVSDACADSTDESQVSCLSRLERQAVTMVTAAELQSALASCADVDEAAKSGIERVKPYLPKAPFLPDDKAAGPVEPYSTIFGPAIRQDLAPESLALLVLDAQRLTCDPDHRVDALTPDSPEFEEFYARTQAALEGISRLLTLCRSHGIAVFHVRTAGNLAGGRDLPAKRKALGLTICASDEAAAFMPEASPVAGEAVLNKTGSSAFNGTGLDRLLANMGAKTVLIAGISLDNAIEASLRSAGDRGYGTVIVIDACAAAASVEAQLANAERGTTNVRSVDALAAEFDSRS